jgi:hypothetical protein
MMSHARALVILAALLCLLITMPIADACSIAPVPMRRPCAGVQFDDGSVTHYTRARPILMQYGLIGSFGIVTGGIDVNPNAMTTPMLREMVALGYQFQDHTQTHNALWWGDPTYASHWPIEIAFSQSVFANIDPSLFPMRAWNQPGGQGEGWTDQLRDTLKAHGYTRAAGRVSLPMNQVMNFHYGLIDDPFSLGRGGVYSWGLNAPAEGWTWQAEVASVITKMADDVAQGLFPIIAFHKINDDAAAGLDSICSWLASQHIDVMGFDNLIELAERPRSLYYDTDLAAPLNIDRDGNGRPDGWFYIDMFGNATDKVSTTVYGIPPGKLLISVTVSGPLQQPYADYFRVYYEKKSVDPISFAYTTTQEYRTHVLVPGESLSFIDTLRIDERVDRASILFTGIWVIPFTIQSFSAVPTSNVTAVNSHPPKADFVVHVWPNPSSGMANIAFHLEKPVHTEVTVYSVDGKFVERLIDAGLSGNVGVRWRNKAVASGVYFIEVTAGRRRAATKITMLK